MPESHDLPPLAQIRTRLDPASLIGKFRRLVQGSIVSRSVTGILAMTAALLVCCTLLAAAAPVAPPAAEQTPVESVDAEPLADQPEDAMPVKPEPAETVTPQEPVQPEPVVPESVQPNDATWIDPIAPGHPAKSLDLRPELPLPSESDKLTFNFSYQPWEDVINWFADRAGLSLLKETLPAGTFNYRDNREYTPIEALNLLNKALLIKGYRLIRAERMLIVINLEDGIPPDLITTVSLKELDLLSEYDLVRVLFELEKFDPEEAELEIQKLIGPQGSVIVMPKTRQLLVTDTVGNLRTMRRVIDRIENPDGIASGEVVVYQPQYILADEAMMVLRQLLDIDEEENATSDGSIRLAIDPLGTKIYFSGKSEMRAKVNQILETIDQPPMGTETGTIEALQMEIYPVTTADPNSVLAVMQTLLAESPGVRLSLDPKTNSLIALARPSEHSTIRATLDQMQSEVRRIEVIYLRSIDPALAALSIKKMFGEASAENTSAPTVEADSAARQLLVYGTDAQIEQIGVLLEKMGEKNIGDASFVDTSTVRMLPLGGRQAEDILERIEMIWPTMRDNRIKVVTPSAVIPTLRPGSRGKPAPMGKDVLQELLRMSPDFRVPALEGASPAKPPTKAPPAAGPVESALPDPPPRTEKSAATDRPVSSAWAPIRLVSEDSDQPKTVAKSSESAKPSPTSQTTDPLLPPVVVSIGSGGLMIACEDIDALNEFEDLVNMLSAGAMSSSPRMTVFYLIHAKAEPVAQTVDAILGGGTMASSSGDSGGGGLLGDLAGAALGDIGGGIVGSLLGFGMGGGSITPTGSIQITPDARLNCLFVQANSADLNMIEELLKILDQSGSPEDVLADPKAQMIPVYNTQAREIAEIVQQVFQENLASTSRNRQPSPQEFIEALRGGRGGSRGSSRGRSTDTAPKMSIGIDARSNSLIVSAPEALFQEVKALVEMLDEAAAESNNDAIQVVKLDSLNPEAVRQALSAIVGDNVTFGSSSSSRGQSSSSSPGSSAGRPPDAPSTNDVRRRMFMRAMQERIRSGGSPFGGGRPDGSGRSGGDSPYGIGRPGGSGPSGGGQPSGR
jgi:type II secretory pathway component GspD/PulD (secretin)